MGIQSLIWRGTILTLITNSTIHCGRTSFELPRDAAVVDSAPSLGGEDAMQTDRANVAFITRGLQQGDLGGVVGADAICNTAARNAGITGRFVAWIEGDSRTNPAELLNGSSGWQMLNGKWLAQTIAQVVNGQWFHPLTQTETNITLDPYATGGLLVAWTGSTTDTCSNWSSPLDSSVGTVKGLLEWGAISGQGEAVKCNLVYRLACFERGYQATRVAPVIDKPLVFVSQGKWRPNPAGRENADALCATEAMGATRGGTFIALLPSSTQTAIARVTSSVFQRSDGELIGSLTSLQTFLMLDAAGQPVTGETWTGGYPDQLAASTCQDWTSNGGTAQTGVAGAMSNPAYVGYGNPSGQQSCNSALHLYCVQQ
jgi:hypothetical protein